MKKWFLVAASIVSFYALSSFSNGLRMMKSIITNEEQIPSDFNPSQSSLLIEDSTSGDKSKVYVAINEFYVTDDYINGYLRKRRDDIKEHASKNYPYKYEFTSTDNIYGKGDKYTDKSIYRYALVIELIKQEQHQKIYNDGKFHPYESTHLQPIFRYHLYDRLNNKTYAALGNGSSIIMMAFKAAIKRIK